MPLGLFLSLHPSLNIVFPRFSVSVYRRKFVRLGATVSSGVALVSRYRPFHSILNVPASHSIQSAELECPQRSLEDDAR